MSKSDKNDSFKELDGYYHLVGNLLQNSISYTNLIYKYNSPPTLLNTNTNSENEFYSIFSNKTKNQLFLTSIINTNFYDELKHNKDQSINNLKIKKIFESIENYYNNLDIKTTISEFQDISLSIKKCLCLGTIFFEISETFLSLIGRELELTIEFYAENKNREFLTQHDFEKQKNNVFVINIKNINNRQPLDEISKYILIANTIAKIQFKNEILTEYSPLDDNLSFKVYVN